MRSEVSVCRELSQGLKRDTGRAQDSGAGATFMATATAELTRVPSSTSRAGYQAEGQADGPARPPCLPGL